MALDQLEATLKKQWWLGQTILLSWTFDPNVGFAIESENLPFAFRMRNRE